jgi:formylglycine-generating enzyme required for sulfatase activity
VDRVFAEHADLPVQRLWFAKESPRATVQVDAFRIGRTPVTVAQFTVYAQARSVDYLPGAGAQHPVTGVSHAGAVDFCAWLSDHLGVMVALPSELQWERAARGEDDRTYPWGKTYAAHRCNLAELGRGGTTAVGSFPLGASAFGVLDMAGNVDEWTSTPYAPYPGAPAEVPDVETWAVDPHITRGGSWRHGRDLARCARRHGVYTTLDDVGFRVATPG